VDGKLYFNLNPVILEMWSKDTKGYIEKAEKTGRESVRRRRQNYDSLSFWRCMGLVKRNLGVQ